MLSWMVSDYMHEKQIMKINIDYEELISKYKDWCAMLKRVSYKEDV